MPPPAPRLAWLRRSVRAAKREVPISSVREGEVVGEHTVRFAGAAEELCLTHRALERGIFARGALAAGLWLAPNPGPLWHAGCHGF